MLKHVRYPDIGHPAEPRPELPLAVFAGRLARVRQRMQEQKLEALVVYGDREHFASLHYLTNYDPRFEESLLVVLPEGTPVLFVGNEGMGYSTIAALPVERRLYQTFSLLGQPREKVRPLADLLRETGLGSCRRVSEAGWKYFSPAEFAEPEEALDLPEYIATALRQAIAPGGRVTNETAVFMDPETGLRNICEPEQLADFEWIATCNSQALLDGIRALRPGMTEHEAFANMRYNGLPLSCHAVCATGERVLRHGFPSASSRRIQLGDPILMTMSYQGANTCRFGWVARGPEDLPAAAKDYVEAAAGPYAEALFAWYETLRVGASGDDLHRAVHTRLDPRGIRLALNAGHQIATDEWTHSLVAAGSRATIRSGMYWQADFFPMTGTPHYGAFAEDGVAVADADLRRQLARRYPAMWQRVEARQRFMREELGVPIGDEVLPFSNFPAAVIPHFLAPDHCLAASTKGERHDSG